MKYFKCLLSSEKNPYKRLPSLTVMTSAWGTEGRKFEFNQWSVLMRPVCEPQARCLPYAWCMTSEG